jgi:peptidoglycan biosynthesis protein MviN/MurJ (putative lipid II flippase)
MGANIALSLVFIQFIGVPGDLARGPFAGLALANALTTLVEGAALWWLMRRRINGVNDARVLGAVWRTGAASAAMGAAIYLVYGWVGAPHESPLQVLTLAGVVGAAVFFGMAFALRLDEARAVPMMVLRRVRR